MTRWDRGWKIKQVTLGGRPFLRARHRDGTDIVVCLDQPHPTRGSIGEESLLFQALQRLASDVRRADVRRMLKKKVNTQG